MPLCKNCREPIKWIVNKNKNTKIPLDLSTKTIRWVEKPDGWRKQTTYICHFDVCQTIQPAKEHADGNS